MSEDETYNGEEGVDVSSWFFVLSYDKREAFEFGKRKQEVRTNG